LKFEHTTTYTCKASGFQKFSDFEVADNGL